jgi:hypothetical protein
MKRVALAAAAIALCACSDPREAELAQELVTLQESRTSLLSVQKLAAEVSESEAALAGLRAERDALVAEIAGATAAAEEAEAAYGREIERNGALNQAIQEGQRRLQEATAREAALGQEIEIARARARTFKDQAAVLVRELRTDDPDWAQDLRIKSLREFLGNVGDTWPGDPVLGEMAKTALPADLREATRVGAERAARVRDRVTEVYGLGEETTAAGPRSAAAESPDAS